MLGQWKLWRKQMIILAAMLAGQRLSAATVNWDGGTDFNWTTAANWSTHALPGTGDDVVLNKASYGSAYTVSLTGGTQSVNSVTADSTSQLRLTNTTLSIANASQINSELTLIGGSIGASATSSGNIVVSGTLIKVTSFSNSGNIQVTSDAEEQLVSVFESTMPLTNTGTIDVDGGIVKLDEGLTSGSVRDELLEVATKQGELHAAGFEIIGGGGFGFFGPEEFFGGGLSVLAASMAGPGMVPVSSPRWRKMIRCTPRAWDIR